MKKRNEFHIEEWIGCPMGTMTDNKIECYYFGIVEIKDCNRCKTRNSS